jgi:hypothetical protein
MATALKGVTNGKTENQKQHKGQRPMCGKTRSHPMTTQKANRRHQRENREYKKQISDAHYSDASA